MKKKLGDSVYNVQFYDGKRFNQTDCINLKQPQNTDETLKENETGKTVEIQARI